MRQSLSRPLGRDQDVTGRDPHHANVTKLESRKRDIRFSPGPGRSFSPHLFLSSTDEGQHRSACVDSAPSVLCRNSGQRDQLLAYPPQSHSRLAVRGNLRLLPDSSTPFVSLAVRLLPVAASYLTVLSLCCPTVSSRTMVSPQCPCSSSNYLVRLGTILALNSLLTLGHLKFTALQAWD